MKTRKDAFHQSDRIGGPPADKGAHPGDLAGDRAVIAMIREGRARNVSWGNLAKMTGRAEADLRKLWGVG